ELTIADVFKANGWRTGVFGKWHLGEGYPFAARFRGFDTTVIHGGGGVGQQPDYWRNDYYAATEATKNHAGDPTDNDHYFHNGSVKEADQFCTDYFFSNAFAFMEDALQEGKPFFCYIPTNAAHGPFNAPPGGKAGFDGLVENIDHNMGRLDEFLTAQGIADDVMVIFTTDNGTAGRQRMGGLRGKKGSHYEGGHNVPCFIRWKGGGMAGTPSTARDVNSLTAAADLFPTFVDLFALKKPSGGKAIHGISLKPMLLDSAHVPESRIWIVDTQRTADLVKWKNLCVMKDEVVDGKIANKWRLTRKNKDSEFELYDWQTDRAQEYNLFDQQAAVARELMELYETWWRVIESQTREYPASVIGVESESVLYSHDWIRKGGAPWHQNHVLKGNSGSRINSVRFAESGTYTVELRRWPREDGGSIDGPDSHGQGTALEIVKATLAIEGVDRWSRPVDSGATHVTFEIDVEAGDDTTLETGFLDQNEEILTGAYYVYVRKKEIRRDETPWPTNEWTRAQPADKELDADRLQQLVTRIRDEEVAKVHSLLIVRDGHLVVEEYFDGHEADELHTQQSVSKSFTSALVGIAIEKGKFSGVNEKVLDFFPDLEGIDRSDRSNDPKRQKMTLKDLLTMRGGTDYHERGKDSPHFQLNRKSQGWTEFILNRPMVYDPGTHFQYDSGAVILTSAMIKQRYGVHADIFAEEHLFKPLGIQQSRWYRNQEEHPHTGGGLDLRSRDMAKLGLLYLRQGRWEDQQVVPRQWVEDSLSRQVEFDPAKGRLVGYGYWWWVLPPDPGGDQEQDIYAALGFMGQHILLVPEHDLIVVVTAGARNGEDDAIIEFFYDEILPSVISDL
ncbi:MAG: serine hydrolase, partial [Pirellulaceae bacterium]